MARMNRRSMNRLQQEIDEGIRDYQADAQERAARRKHGRLIAILIGEASAEGIFYRRPRERADADQAPAGVRSFDRPTLWS